MTEPDERELTSDGVSTVDREELLLGVYVPVFRELDPERVVVVLPVVVAGVPEPERPVYEVLVGVEVREPVVDVGVVRLVEEPEREAPRVDPDREVVREERPVLLELVLLLPDRVPPLLRPMLLPLFPRLTLLPVLPRLTLRLTLRPALLPVLLPVLLRPALLPALLRPALLRPALLRPALLRPALLRPAVLRPAVLRPAVLPALLRPALLPLLRPERWASA